MLFKCVDYKICSLFWCPFRHDYGRVIKLLVGDEHNIVGFDGFLVGLFAFGIGFVDLGPRGKDEYLRIVAEILNGMLEFGRWGLMGKVCVSESVGDSPIEEKNRFLFLVLFEGSHGAGKHEVGVSGYICPREGVSVSGDLFPDDLPGYFGNILETLLGQRFQ